MSTFAFEPQPQMIVGGFTPRRSASKGVASHDNHQHPGQQLFLNVLEEKFESVPREICLTCRADKDVIWARIVVLT